MHIDPEICGWDTSSLFLIFSDNVFGQFIYYSHLLPVVTLLLLSGILLWQNWRERASQALFFVALAFSAWSLSDLVLWATARPEHTMFFWSIIIHFELLVYIGMWYFAHYLIVHRAPTWKQELPLFIAYVPLILFAHTPLNLTGFDYTNCYREALEGPLLTYAYALEFLIAGWILYIAGKEISTYRKVRVREITLATFGILAFLISFSLGNIIGTIEINWELGQWGLFGAPVFAGLLTYLVIKYKSINTKLFGAEALLIGIGVLIFSIIFLRSIENVRIITMVTSVLVALLGFFLIRSVKREIAARERNELLAKDLAKANARLRELDRQKSEFVSIASHQLRSPLTAIRGYASMLLEGSYGKVPKKAEEVIGRIQESSGYMASSIEDFLNVSRIEQGRMKYELAKTDISLMAEKVVEEMRASAAKKGVLLEFRGSQSVIANIDPGKMRQVIYNLVDNALKYTPQGRIEVAVDKNPGAQIAAITVTDTGVGMSTETQAAIFDKFVRAKNANSVNVSGTGLGLYVAKQMIEAMQGRISATSKGEGKGSTFKVIIPLAS